MKINDPPMVIQFVRAGEWVVLGCGQDGQRLQLELLTRIGKDGCPWGTARLSWLEVFADWPRLKPHLPFALPKKGKASGEDCQKAQA